MNNAHHQGFFPDGLQSLADDRRPSLFSSLQKVVEEDEGMGVVGVKHLRRMALSLLSQYRGWSPHLNYHGASAFPEEKVGPIRKAFFKETQCSLNQVTHRGFIRRSEGESQEWILSRSGRGALTWMRGVSTINTVFHPWISCWDSKLRNGRTRC